MHNRVSYPFISATGDSTLVKNAVDDMVVYVAPGDPIPLSARTGIDNGALYISIHSNDDELIATAYEDSAVIKGINGDVRGFIRWLSEGCTSLKANIIANDPQPWNTLYIDPSACIARIPQCLSSVRVNGEEIPGYTIDIQIPKDNKSLSKDNESLSIDETGVISLYRDYSKEDFGISQIVFTIPGKGDTTYDNLNGHVVMASTAESDVRVVTSDVIYITEITNDNI